MAQWPQFGQAVVDTRVCDGTAVAGDKAPSDKLSDDMSGKALLEGVSGASAAGTAAAAAAAGGAADAAATSATGGAAAVE